MPMEAIRRSLSACPTIAVTIVSTEAYSLQLPLGRVTQLCEMSDSCLRNPSEGEDLAADDARMMATRAFVYKGRCGIKLNAGAH